MAEATPAAQPRFGESVARPPQALLRCVESSGAGDAGPCVMRRPLVGAAFWEFGETGQPSLPAVTSQQWLSQCPCPLSLVTLLWKLLRQDPAFRNLQIKTWVVGVCPCPCGLSTSTPAELLPSIAANSVQLVPKACSAALHPEQGVEGRPKATRGCGEPRSPPLLPQVLGRWRRV